MKDISLDHIKRTVAVLNQVLEDETLLHAVSTVANLTAQAMRSGRKLLIAGNGGSAADAQHIAAEFVVRLTVDRPAMRAVALTTDSSILTAIGNDYEYDFLFRRQLEAIAEEGDVFLGISTSGNSRNILQALEYCRVKGIISVGLTGSSGGKMIELCDHVLRVPSSTTAHIQETHLVLEHILCGLVERVFFDGLVR